MPALQAKKEVFVEWPLGANTSQAEMTALAKKQGVKTAVGLQARLAPIMLKVCDMQMAWCPAGDIDNPQGQGEIIDSAALGHLNSTTLTATTSRILRLPEKALCFNNPTSGKIPCDLHRLSF